MLIPAFAVDRTELVLLELRRLMRAGEIPRLPVYVDSPMALAALAVYRRAITGRSSQIGTEADPVALLDPGDLHAVHTAEESARLNRPAYPCIVISASGWAPEGGSSTTWRTSCPTPATPWC